MEVREKFPQVQDGLEKIVGQRNDSPEKNRIESARRDKRDLGRRRKKIRANARKRMNMANYASDGTVPRAGVLGMIPAALEVLRAQDGSG